MYFENSNIFIPIMSWYIIYWTSHCSSLIIRSVFFFFPSVLWALSSLSHFVLNAIIMHITANGGHMIQAMLPTQPLPPQTLSLFCLKKPAYCLIINKALASTHHSEWRGLFQLPAGCWGEETAWRRGDYWKSTNQWCCSTQSTTCHLFADMCAHIYTPLVIKLQSCREKNLREWINQLVHTEAGFISRAALFLLLVSH